MASVNADQTLERALVETGSRELERQLLCLAWSMVAVRV